MVSGGAPAQRESLPPARTSSSGTRFRGVPPEVSVHGIFRSGSPRVSVHESRPRAPLRCTAADHERQVWRHFCSLGPEPQGRLLTSLSVAFHPSVSRFGGLREVATPAASPDPQVSRTRAESALQNNSDRPGLSLRSATAGGPVYPWTILDHCESPAGCCLMGQWQSVPTGVSTQLSVIPVARRVEWLWLWLWAATKEPLTIAWVGAAARCSPCSSRRA
jgi:hypothetical protein